MSATREATMDGNASNGADDGLSRRGLLMGTALLGVGTATLASGAGDAVAATSRPDPMAPIPIPPQVPANEGVAVVPDTRLWYWDTGGTGQPIVLMHPATGSGLIWGYQQPVFAKAGYRVIGYSRRGYINSAPFDRNNAGIGSEDLRALADHLGLGRFHLVASAAGGSIASDFAFSYQ